MTSEKDVLAYFEERFGIPKSIFSQFRLYSDQKDRVFMAPKGLAAEEIAVTVGMQIARTGKAIKPSSNFLQAFGRHAARSFIPLSREQAVAYVRGDDITLSAQKESLKSALPASFQASDGYVVLKYLDFPLGCGLLKGGQIKNVLPKARRMQVKFL